MSSRSGSVELLSAQFSVQSKKLLKRPQDHARAASGRNSRFPRQVSYGAFRQPGTPRDHAREQFGRKHGPGCLNLQSCESFASEELEGTIDIAHRNIEKAANEHVPGMGVGAPNRIVLTPHPVADHNIAIINLLDQPLQALDIELPIAVSKKSEVPACNPVHTAAP